MGDSCFVCGLENKRVYSICCSNKCYKLIKDKEVERICSDCGDNFKSKDHIYNARCNGDRTCKKLNLIIQRINNEKATVKKASLTKEKTVIPCKEVRQTNKSYEEKLIKEESKDNIKEKSIKEYNKDMVSSDKFSESINNCKFEDYKLENDKDTFIKKFNQINATGELKLIKAIILQAIIDLKGNMDYRGELKLAKNEAKNFLNKNNPLFCYYCELINLDHNRFDLNNINLEEDIKICLNRQNSGKD